MLIRENYLNWLKQTKDNEFVKVITGVRRSGKSVILMQYKEYLEKSGIKSSKILFYNF